LDGIRGEIFSQNWKVFDLRMLMLLRLWMSLTLVSKGFFAGVLWDWVSGRSQEVAQMQKELIDPCVRDVLLMVYTFMLFSNCPCNKNQSISH
jgi:hypothetical protein